MSFLELEQLEKMYPDGTHAVRRIQLAVEQGQFVVLLGPSGCGKTTTLRMVAGLELPTGGTIRISGQDVTRQPPSQRDVGFVFQFYALYPHLSVRENILFPLKCAGVGQPEREQALASVVDRLGLASLLKRHPRQLGGGDQQRVALARAMIRRPSLWLMDEPLGTLDADRRLEMREFIRTQQLQAKVTTLYVTHDQEEAMSLADLVVVMNAGQIQQAGPPADIYDHPANLFVAKFVGSPGMNLLPGRIEREGARYWLRVLAGALKLPIEGTYEPRLVTLGVRPEFVRLLPGDDENSLSGQVTVNEYMGSHRNLHLRVGDAQLVVRADRGDALAVGSQLRVGFDPQHLHLFDPATGARFA